MGHNHGSLSVGVWKSTSKSLPWTTPIITLGETRRDKLKDIPETSVFIAILIDERSPADKPTTLEEYRGLKTQMLHALEVDREIEWRKLFSRFHCKEPCV